MSSDNIQVKVNSNGTIASDPARFGAEMIKHTNETAINAGRYLLGELIKATPVGVSGIMRRSWHMEVFKTGDDGVSISIYNSAEHYETVEFGRRAAPVSREGRKSLELWVRRKLGVPAREAPYVAFLIARKKALHPTPGQHFTRDTIARQTPIIVHYLIAPRIQNKINQLEGTAPKEII